MQVYELLNNFNSAVASPNGSGQVTHLQEIYSAVTLSRKIRLAVQGTAHAEHRAAVRASEAALATGADALKAEEASDRTQTPCAAS
jgi:hypothetical protein